MRRLYVGLAWQRLSLCRSVFTLCTPFLQGMNVAGTVLPKLDRLTGLTALNLSENMLTEVPQQLGKLGSLRFLDLSLNVLLKVGCASSRLCWWLYPSCQRSDGGCCKASGFAHGNVILISLIRGIRTLGTAWGARHAVMPIVAHS